MESKNLVIIALTILVLYLIYQQNQSQPLQPNSQELKNLENQVQHYQTLYQKRVEKDLGYSESEKENSGEVLTNQDKEILQKVQEFNTLIENTEDHSIDRNKMNEIENLADQITQPQVKALANQVVTNSAYILGHKNLLKKLSDKETEISQVQKNFNEKLRKINVLFDENAKDYEAVDFTGLFSLLEKVKAERERERAKISELGA